MHSIGIRHSSDMTMSFRTIRSVMIRLTQILSAGKFWEPSTFHGRPEQQRVRCLFAAPCIFLGLFIPIAVAKVSAGNWSEPLSVPTPREASSGIDIDSRNALVQARLQGKSRVVAILVTTVAACDT